MPSSQSSEETILDFVTGKLHPNVGAESNRQAIEHLLVNHKGYLKSDIRVDVPIVLRMDDQIYRSTIDLIVYVKQRPYMAIKCAPGSLASREKEIIAAARLLGEYQVPLSVSSDGRTAIVWDTVSGKKIGQDLEAVPSKTQAEDRFEPTQLIQLPADRLRRQQLIFRSYDTMNINRAPASSANQGGGINACGQGADKSISS